MRDQINVLKDEFKDFNCQKKRALACSVDGFSQWLFSQQNWNCRFNGAYNMMEKLNDV